MSATCFVDRDLHLVVSSGHGSLSWREVKRCQDQTCADPDFSSEFNQLVDMRAVTGFDMIFDHVRMLARRRIFSLASKRAFVASNPAAFGMGRMWQALVELSDHPSQIRVFYDLPCALQWLGLRALPSPIRPEVVRTEARTSAELEDAKFLP